MSDPADIGTVMRAAEQMRDQHGADPFWLILADWLDAVAKRARSRPRVVDPEMRYALPAARAYLDRPKPPPVDSPPPSYLGKGSW